MLRQFFLVVTLGLALLASTGCGIKGPLVLPPKAAPQPAAATTPAAPVTSSLPASAPAEKKP
jgi:predicted small lipoprotein YifL